MSEVLVQALELTKHFLDRKRGIIEAVKGISFQAYAGEIFGLLGPNGAGKTTTLRMLATILTPTSGTATIGGEDIVSNPDGARRMLGFLSGDTGLYGRLTAREMVEYFAKLYGIDTENASGRANELCQQLDMGDFWNRRCGKLSTGQRQKVNIARTVVHNPPVLILDEPTAGLDVLASRNIVQFIRSAQAQSKCVILSTHDMGEAERLCDRIGIIHNGRIATIGTKSELYNRFNADNLEDVFLKAIEEN